ncbi:MAG: hypothetical protein F6K24_04160 [Okeania sp. SIO2D1]|nr:hypothetical protein [Okeania sp. SIO2D1]
MLRLAIKISNNAYSEPRLTATRIMFWLRLFATTQQDFLAKKYRCSEIAIAQ